MAYLTESPRTLVLRVRRDTVALVVGATAVTFALSNAIHARRDSTVATARNTQAAPAEQDWTGNLADPTSIETVAQPMPFTSASLVVPRSELALPQTPVRALVKLRGCQGSACVAARTTAPRHAVPTPNAVNGIAVAELAPNRTLLRQAAPRPDAPKPDAPRPKAGFMSRMNPLGYLPGMSTIKRPFTYAGETVTGCFRRF